MKRLSLTLIALAAVLAVPAFAATGAEGADPTGGKITVTGNGLVESTPDVVEWWFGVQAEADSATKALSATNAAMRRIVSAVRGAGVAADDVRTEHVSLSPKYEETGRLTDRFTAASSVHVTVRKLAQAGAIVDAAVDAGANSVSGPMFAETSREQLYRQALTAAFDQAKLSAQALAQKSGVALGRVLEITEGGGVQPLPMAEASRGMDAPTQIEPGRSSTYATVTVTFATS